jgi:sugar (glycoside-pentoside-hexuronide) transporter
MAEAVVQPSAAPQPEPSRLTPGVKAIFALGDHTVNLVLSALSFYYLFFLTEVAGLAAGLAGLVPLLARAVDAFADPIMGRVSDLTRMRSGRRRPYFLIGVLPFGLSFAALWWNVPFESEAARFAYYAAAYLACALSMTVLSVPYMALLPELAADYQSRTDLNIWRTAAAILGTLLGVVAFEPLIESFGGGAAGYAAAGTLLAFWVMTPWIPIFRVTWERPDFAPPSEMPHLEGVRLLFRHRSYMRLMAFFLLCRIAIDLASAMFLYYFTYWIGRPGDFAITMGIFLVAVVASLPFWLFVSQRVDKRALFIAGAAWWVGAQFFMWAAQPEWPRAWIFLGATLAGIGFAAADVMPWSMLGDVVDEDELSSGERREGLYAGFFTFLRKLGGAGAVALGGFTLELSGYEPGRPQSETTLWTIRVLTAGAPGVFVLLSAWVARSYPIGRARHAQILDEIQRRRDAQAAP